MCSSMKVKNCTCTDGSSRKGRRAKALGGQMTSWNAKQMGREARMRAKPMLLRRESLSSSVLISTSKHPSSCPCFSLSIALGVSAKQRTKYKMNRTTSNDRSTYRLACSYSATMQRISDNLCVLPFRYQITALKSRVITPHKLPKYTHSPNSFLSPTISIISRINIPGRRNVKRPATLLSTQCGRILIPMRSRTNSGINIREQTLVREGGLICTKQGRQLVKQYWKKEKVRSEGKEGWKQKQCSVVSSSRCPRISRDRFVTRVYSSKYIISNTSCFTFPSIYYMLQDSRARKTQRQAETTAFTCYLIYFTVAALFMLVLFQYSNYLSGSWLCWPYGVIIIMNTYLLLTTGANPGFMPKCTDDEQVQIGELGGKICSVCQCEVRNRSKHCFRCGRCVMKYDHHCPWIGSCVGEYNHGKFWWGLLFHTLLSSSSLKICCSTMAIYGYATQDGSYQPEFGVFAVFALGMFFYLLFAACLLLFHTYLLITNTTTKEIIDRSKLDYLRGVKGNPFSEGCFRNIAMGCCPQEGGRDWIVSQENSERGWMSRILSNEYYECC